MRGLYTRYTTPPREMILLRRASILQLSPRYFNSLLFLFFFFFFFISFDDSNRDNKVDKVLIRSIILLTDLSFTHKNILYERYFILD